MRRDCCIATRNSIGRDAHFHIEYAGPVKRT